MTGPDQSIRIAPEVEEALAKSRPVVALETTLVTHGLPRPQGIEVAFELEEIVRDQGATPATVAILDGAAHIGASRGAIRELAASSAEKVNLGNLAVTLASRRPGSTTVAATMALAHSAGIRVFATGGIGGVHRGSAETGDISADLQALARYGVAVVCAGAKAILDLPKTVEALETLGVPVLGFRTGEFPAFYRRSSGLRLDHRCNSVVELAGATLTHFALGDRPTGVLVANPIGADHEMPEATYENALTRAFEALAATRVEGREVTPFLLERLDHFSDGLSVRVNRELLAGNARLAARLAAAMAPRD